MNNVCDPLRLRDLLWPDVVFYDKQVDIIYSVWNDDETVVPAGNMLGKDFVGAFIILAVFLTRNPCRIITTSVKDAHLDVLWGEMNRFIQEAASPLRVEEGGPLIVNQKFIRKIYEGEVEPLSYIRGMVAGPDTVQSFQGHHIAKTGDRVPRTMLVGDEASALSPVIVDTMARPWANRIFQIGNCWDCPPDNSFRSAVEGVPGGQAGGDIPDPDNPGRYYRRVIKIRAEDSPNVQYGLHQKRMGLTPTDEMLIPGVLSYSDYIKRRRTWDPIKQTVSLDAEFYKGPQIVMYPEEWLEEAVARAAKLSSLRTGLAMGVDSAMGGDNTSFAVTDTRGLIYLEGLKTVDTTLVVDKVLELKHRFQIPAENILFDYGGGGKPHVDRMRRMGHAVRAVQFGASATPFKRRGVTTLQERIRADEIRLGFKNRRAEMYWLLREVLNPNYPSPFALPSKLLYAKRLDGGPSLYHQLLAVPLRYDEEGRVYLPPKRARTDDPRAADKETMTSRTGCSPDEADALVLGVFAFAKQIYRATAGVIS